MMSLFETLPWLSIVGGAVVLLAVIGAWVWFEQRVDPGRGAMEEPDGNACLRGKCGDAMEISLKFSNDRVVDAKYWTDGCRMSGLCGAAAAKLALDKTPEEIADIDYQAIEREVGGLPEEDLHCATLAAGVLQEALRDYLFKDKKGTTTHDTALSPVEDRGSTRVIERQAS
ncbi:MAG: iron-sulfur cluster assembly scaffold protein [Desulfomonilaceae bacterium]